jgi:hypothetical protein
MKAFRPSQTPEATAGRKDGDAELEAVIRLLYHTGERSLAGLARWYHLPLNRVRRIVSGRTARTTRS